MTQPINSLSTTKLEFQIHRQLLISNMMKLLFSVVLRHMNTFLKFGCRLLIYRKRATKNDMIKRYSDIVTTKLMIIYDDKNYGTAYVKTNKIETKPETRCKKNLWDDVTQ